MTDHDREALPEREVLWITTGYPWPGDGVQGIFHQTAIHALADLGVTSTVIAAVPATPWPLARLRDRWAGYAAVPLRYLDDDVAIRRPRFPAIPGLPPWSHPEHLIARAVLGTLAGSERVRLVHSHYAFPSAPAGQLVARRLGVPHVVTVHGDDINTWPARHPRQLPLVLRALRSADGLIAVSQALADGTAALCGRRPRVIPVGIDVASFARPAPDKSTARQLLGIGSSEFVALFVGHVGQAKGARRFVDGILMLHGRVRGILVGAGPDVGYRSNESVGTVEYVGVKTSREVALYMRAADAVVLPSDGEGMPTVLVEAGAVGTYVIATPVGGIPELIGEGRGWLLDDRSPQSIAVALASAMGNPEQSEAASSALRAWVSVHHDANRNALELARYYDELAPTLTAPG